MKYESGMLMVERRDVDWLIFVKNGKVEGLVLVCEQKKVKWWER